MILNEEAADILIKQLAFENANATCQSLSRPIRKTGSIGDYIKQCSEVFPAFIQVVTIAAALKGETYSQYIKNINKTKKGNNRSNSGLCYSCQ